MKQTFLTVAFISLMAIIAGCLGGKSSDTKSSSSSSGYAQFIDAPVQGLKVTRLASGEEVITDSDGRFDCDQDEILRFSLGGLQLGQVACNPEVFVTDLGEDRWSKAAKILQCLSSTDPSEGRLDVTHVGDEDLTEIDLNGDDEGDLDDKLSLHKRRDVTISDAEAHAMRHLLDRVEYDPAFEALFTSESTLLKSVTVRKEETFGTGTERCPNFYNIKFKINKQTQLIDSIERNFYSARLINVAAYSTLDPHLGDSCAEMGLANSCKDWTASEMGVGPAIRRDKFKLAIFKNITTPEDGIFSGVKRLKVKGEFGIVGGELVLDVDWKNEFNLNLQNGDSVAGSCEYKSDED